MAIGQVQHHTPVYKKHTTAKAVVGTIATAGAIATGLALGAKTGKFTVNDNSGKIAKAILPYLDKAGNMINSQASKIKNAVTKSNVFENVKEKLQNSGILDAIKEGFNKGKDAVAGNANKV